MTEHLAIKREEYVQPAPAPAGIVKFPVENGIDPTLPPDQIRREAEIMGASIVRVALSTDFNPYLSEIPYSETRVEADLEQASQSTTETSHRSEIAHLQKAARSSNPDIRRAAEQALEAITAHNSASIPKISESAQKLQVIKAKEQRGAKLTLQERQEKGRLEAELKQQRKAGSNPLKRRKKRGREAKARQNMIDVGYSEEKIAQIMGTRGSTTKTRQVDTRDHKKRIRREDAETRNVVGRIGAVVIGPDGNRYIVKDLESQPAQSFKVIGYKPKDGKPLELGDPIFETEPKRDPLTGAIVTDPAGDPVMTEVLHDLYTKVTILDPSDPTKKITTHVLVPRDDPYLRDTVRQSGPDAHFFHQEVDPATGNVNYVLANPAGIGDDSFSPIDDKVVLQRLYSGAEAFNLIVNGGGAPYNWEIRIGDLSQRVDDKVVRVVKEKDRDIEKSLVFMTSDEVIDGDLEARSPGRPSNYRPIPGIVGSGLLSTYDESQEPGIRGVPTKRVAGHFRRFDHSRGTPSPITSRQRAQERHLQLVGRQRMLSNLGKSLSGRGKKLPNI
jgi:hypothetical protein